MDTETANRGQWVWPLLIALLLSGCLDVEHKVTLNRKGAGEVSFDVTIDPMFADALLEREHIFSTPIEEVGNTEFTYVENADYGAHAAYHRDGELIKEMGTDALESLRSAQVAADKGSSQLRDREAA